jgi:hypothetical protein
VFYRKRQTLRKPSEPIWRTQGFAAAPKSIILFSRFSRCAAEFRPVFAE